MALDGRGQTVDLRAGLGTGVSVTQEDQRYALNASLFHEWLRDARFVPEKLEGASPEPDADDGEGMKDAV